MSDLNAPGKPQRPPPPVNIKSKGSQPKMKIARNVTPPASVKSNESGSQETIKAFNHSSTVSSTGTTPRRESRTAGTGAGPSGSRSCIEHSFRTSVADVREMEHSLLQLLDDFHAGKLQAFGNEASFEKMDQVREQQERLARMHFEMDSEQEKLGLESDTARTKAKENMTSLVSRLKELSQSLQHLQKD